MPARSPEETHALLKAALNASDPDGFVDVFEEDATMIVPHDGSTVNGRAEIRRSLEPIVALTRRKAEIAVVGKLVNDGLALTHARWNVSGTDADGHAVELAGSGSIVSRRQPDGHWLIVLDNPITP